MSKTGHLEGELRIARVLAQGRAAVAITAVGELEGRMRSVIHCADLAETDSFPMSHSRTHD